MVNETLTRPGLPTTRADRLRIQIWWLGSGTTPVFLQVRQLLTEGRESITNEQITADASANPVSLSFPLTDGYLLSASLISTTGSPSFGQLYGTIALQSGNNAVATNTLQLAAGFITQAPSLNYPFTPSRIAADITPDDAEDLPTAPAAGAPLILTFNTQGKHRLTGLAFRFTADANAANRTILATFSSPNGALYTLTSRTNITATQSREIWFWSGENLPADNALQHYVPLTFFPFIQALEVTVTANNMQAGDAIENVISFTQSRPFA